MLVPMKSILEKASKNGYAVGAFNINNMEFLQAVIAAAEKLSSPVIIATSQGALSYAGIETIHAMVSALARKSKIPIALHLDHGRDFEIIKRCISKGWTSVMYDGSHLPFKKNVSLTKKVVSFAHKKGVSVEGELGTIGGAEEAIKSRRIILTEPEAAKDFVEKTGVDALAVAIGTSHGAYKFSGKARLEITRLREIKNKLKIPLVLHGASLVPRKLVKLASRYGAKLERPRGIPIPQLKMAIKHGISKVNTDTDLRLAFIACLRKQLEESPEVLDPRRILSPARELVQKIVEERIKLFGSGGMA